MPDNTNTGTPQFAKAEYADGSAAATCQACGQKISGDYYRVNGAATCADCTRRLQEQLPQDSHQAFARALLFGVGAAILGFILYVVFALTTGLISGFVSLAVGYVVGKAMVAGSRGVGGRRYQIAAVLLTYMAVSLAAVPIAISVHMKHKGAQQQTQAGEPAAPEPAASTAAPQATEPAASAAAPAPAAPEAKMSFVRAFGMLTVLGLASPFLALADPAHGVIGLIILLVGIRIAWQLTAARRLEISGPVASSAPAAAR